MPKGKGTGEALGAEDQAKIEQAEKEMILIADCFMFAYNPWGAGVSNCYPGFDADMEVFMREFKEQSEDIDTESHAQGGAGGADYGWPWTPVDFRPMYADGAKTLNENPIGANVELVVHLLNNIEDLTQEQFNHSWNRVLAGLDQAMTASDQIAPDVKKKQLEYRLAALKSYRFSTGVIEVDPKKKIVRISLSSKIGHYTEQLEQQDERSGYVVVAPIGEVVNAGGRNRLGTVWVRGESQDVSQGRAVQAVEAGQRERSTTVRPEDRRRKTQRRKSPRGDAP